MRWDLHSNSNTSSGAEFNNPQWSFKGFRSGGSILVECPLLLGVLLHLHLGGFEHRGVAHCGPQPRLRITCYTHKIHRVAPLAE